MPDDWMHCLKLLGQWLMARDFDRQLAELQVRIAVLKRYMALGIPPQSPAPLHAMKVPRAGDCSTSANRRK